MTRAALAAALTLLTAGCGGVQPRYFFDDDAFYAPPHGYRVRYVHGLESHRALLGRGWTIVNWSGDREMRPDVGPIPEAWPSDDLRLVDGVDGSVIWLRGVRAAHMDRHTVEQVAHAYVTHPVPIAARCSAVVAAPETLIAQGPATLGGRPAWIAVFDVVRPGTPCDHARVVIVVARVPRTPDELVVAGYAAPPGRFGTHRADFEWLLSRLDFSR